MRTSHSTSSFASLISLCIGPSQLSPDALFFTWILSFASSSPVILPVLPSMQRLVTACCMHVMHQACISLRVSCKSKPMMLQHGPYNIKPLPPFSLSTFCLFPHKASGLPPVSRICWRCLISKCGTCWLCGACSLVSWGVSWRSGRT